MQLKKGLTLGVLATYLADVFLHHGNGLGNIGEYMMHHDSNVSMDAYDNSVYDSITHSGDDSVDNFLTQNHIASDGKNIGYVNGELRGLYTPTTVQEKRDIFEDIAKHIDLFPVASAAEDVESYPEDTGFLSGAKGILKLVYNTILHPFSDSEEIKLSDTSNKNTSNQSSSNVTFKSSSNNQTNQTILVITENGGKYCALRPGENLTEDFVRECIKKGLPYYGTDERQSLKYEGLYDEVLGRGIPAEEPLPKNYDVHADPAFAGAKFKEPFYLASWRVVEHYGGLDNLDANLTSLSRGMSSILTRFDTGIAIGDFKSAGVTAPEKDGAMQVLQELNSNACQYLRDNDIGTDDKFFVWFIDEEEWNKHVWDYPDKDALGWPDLGILVKVHEFDGPGGPMAPSHMAHELAHMFRASDRSGGGDIGDLMYDKPIPLGPSTFGNAQNIAMNPDMKLNTC